MLDTLIFDGSGVLFDDLYTVWKADSDAFEACGLGRIPTLEQFKEEFRLPISEYCIAKGASGSLLPRLEEEFRRAYPKYSSRIKVFPEVESVLKKLKRRRIVMAVTSNMPSPFLNEHLQDFGIDTYFDITIGQDDCEEKKPSPKPILITLERLSRKPNTSACWRYGRGHYRWKTSKCYHVCIEQKRKLSPILEAKKTESRLPNF